MLLALGRTQRRHICLRLLLLLLPLLLLLLVPFLLLPLLASLLLTVLPTRTWSCETFSTCHMRAVDKCLWNMHTHWTHIVICSSTPVDTPAQRRCRRSAGCHPLQAGFGYDGLPACCHCPQQGLLRPLRLLLCLLLPALRALCISGVTLLATAVLPAVVVPNWTADIAAGRWNPEAASDPPSAARCCARARAAAMASSEMAAPVALSAGAARCAAAAARAV